MRDRVPASARRALAGFNSFTPGQKAVTLVAVVALAIGGFFFASWASAPALAPLFSNLSGTDASAIVEELSAAGTTYELTDGGGTIMVPRDQVYDLRIKMSGAGLPGEADTGYALLDKQGITTSEFMQQVGYQRALEGELATTIQAIEGVKAATVHLVIPKKDVFSDDQSKPTASVLVASQAGKDLTFQQVQAILHLVASSVEGLETEQVTVAGADGRVLSAGGGQALSMEGDLRSQQTGQYEQRMNTALQRMLDSVLGAGHAVVQTTADLDFDQTETKTQKYTADAGVPPLAETTSKEAYTGANGAPSGGVLGPDNIQVPNGAAGKDGKYESSTSTKNNAVGVVTETRKLAPGSVNKLSVSVLLDSKVAGTLDTAQVQQMITTAAGLDAKRGDKVSVVPMPFDTSANEKAEAELAQAGAAEKQDQLFSMAKTGSLVLAVLLLVFMAWRASRRAAKRSRLSEAELDEVRAALEGPRTLAIAGGGTDLTAIGAAPTDTRTADREARQRELANMVSDQPEDVANLLRSWIADGRR